MLGFGFDISTLSIQDMQLQSGIPQLYVDESGNQYITENGLNNYTTEG